MSACRHLSLQPLDEEKKVRTRKLTLPSPARIRRSSVAHFVFGTPSPAASLPSVFFPPDSPDNGDDYLPTTFDDGRASPSTQHKFSTFGRNRTKSVIRSKLSVAGVGSDPQPCMGRAMRVVVAGAKRVGKTAILEQIACLNDITRAPYNPTLDDTYQVLLEDGDRPREILVFHDTEGLRDFDSELKRAYLQVADAFVLVYSVNDNESFNRMDVLKKHIDKALAKEKKEVPIVVLGNQTDLPGRKVDSEFALTWATREKVKLFEVTATDRNTLIDFVHYLGQRHFHPKESKFSLTKKLKSEKSNAAILMDF